MGKVKETPPEPVEEGRHKLCVRIGTPLNDALEQLRFKESRRLGRRISLRQLVEQILTDALEKRK